MSRNLDQILAVIDTGLQTAGDVVYGNDHHDTCWRCRRAVEAELCGACREELLAEVEAVAPPPPVSGCGAYPGQRLVWWSPR